MILKFQTVTLTVHHPRTRSPELLACPGGMYVSSSLAIPQQRPLIPDIVPGQEGLQTFLFFLPLSLAFDNTSCPFCRFSVKLLANSLITAVGGCDFIGRIH